MFPYCRILCKSGLLEIPDNYSVAIVNKSVCESFVLIKLYDRREDIRSIAFIVLEGNNGVLRL